MVTGHMTSMQGGGGVLHLGGGVCLPGVGGQQTTLPPGTRKAGSMHPTGMLSFYDILTGPGSGHGSLAPESATDQAFCPI